MKRLILLLLIIPFISFAQTGEIKPITAKNVTLTPNNASIWFNPLDTVAGLSMGTYGYLNLLGVNKAAYRYVPYNGATKPVNLGDKYIQTTVFRLDTTYNTTGVEPIGSMFWDKENHTFTTVLEGVRLQNGQEVQVYGKNTSGVIIKNGYPVSMTTNPAQFTTFERTDITNVLSAQAFVGLATMDIGINQFGYVTIAGQVRDIPNATTSLIEKQPIYVSSTLPYLSSSMPTAPSYIIKVGNCERAHATQGRINVNSSITPRLEDLSDVNGTSLTTTGQFPLWNQDRQVFDFNYNVWPDLISDAAYSSLWNGQDSTSASKNAIYDKIETLVPITYCPTTMTVNTGTLIQGTVADLCAIGGTDVIIQEAIGADPLRVTFTFNPVARLTSFSFFGRYTGGAAHVTYIEAYNYTAAAWQLVGELGNTAVKQWQSYNIFLPTNFIDSGTVQVRFNHQGNGINTHQLILDYVDVNYGGAGGSSFETASEIAFIPNGNIASTNVQAAIEELDTEKEPLLTKGNLTESITGLQFDNTRQVIGGAADLSVTSGYLIPTTASATDWDSKAPSSGSDNYIWNGTSIQPNSSAWISGNITNGGGGTTSIENKIYKATATDYAVLTFQNIADDKVFAFGMRSSNSTPSNSFSIYSSLLGGDVLNILGSGEATFASTVNSTGYLFNNNNLFSSLSTNAIAKWDGTKFVDGSGGATNLSYSTTTSTVTVISDTGTDAILPAATQSSAGVLNSVDKTKIDNIWKTDPITSSGTTVTVVWTATINPEITLTGNTTLIITDMPSGGEAQIEVTNGSSSYTFNLNGSTGYTTEVVMGNNATINTTIGSHTSVVIWRRGSTLYYGFVYDN